MTSAAHCTNLSGSQCRAFGRLTDLLSRAAGPFQYRGDHMHAVIVAMWLVGLITAAVAEDKPTLEDLLNPARNPAPSKAAPSEQLDQIAAEMRAVRDKLTGRDTSAATQSLQQTILDQLDELLKTPPSPPPPPSGSGGGGGGNDSANNNRSNSGGRSNASSNHRSATNPGKGGGNPQSGDPMSAGSAKQTGGKERSQADDSEERAGERRKPVDPAARRRQLEVDIWGHLPEKLREQLLNSYGERMLPQYEEQVRKFYDQLSDPQRARRP